MRLGVVGNLIAHAWFQNEVPAIVQLSAQLALHAEKNMAFATPVIGQIAGRVFDQADPDIGEILSSHNLNI